VRILHTENVVKNQAAQSHKKLLKNDFLNLSGVGAKL
jgi:hypothetical protein